jgi:general secretion pathway protein K
MALVSVLWGVALLSVIATSLLAAGNASYRLARNAVELSQSEAVADAGINRAILALLDPRPDKRWRVDGTSQSFAFSGIPIRLAIQDELGRIDLNYADGSLLAALFRSVGLGALSANSLVDKILDWRDPNPSHRLNGAKQNDYRESGYLYQPRSGPFQSVDELKLVMGVNPELFKRVEPALTVYSGHQFFDPQVAPREVLIVLPAMNTETVGALVAARSGMQPDAGSTTGVLAPPTAAPGRAFMVRAEVQKPDVVRVREAVVRLTGDLAQPYWVLSWKTKS